MKPSEKFPKGLTFTPKYMMRGLNNMEWIDWKKEQTDKVADIYKDEEAFLNSNPKPKAAYYKGIINIKKGRTGTPYQMRDAFGKGTEGTYSKPYQILQKNVNKNHWTGEFMKCATHTPSFYNQTKHHLVKERFVSWLMIWMLVITTKNTNPNEVEHHQLKKKSQKYDYC